MNRSPTHPDSDKRAGTIIPLLVFAMLTVCAAGALVLDRLWVDAAELQLRAAAEAAALAAASQLVDDEHLSELTPTSNRLERARMTAGRIAAMNTVSGRPLELDLRPGGDVRFGRSVKDQTTGQEMFLETDVEPTSVTVLAQRLRRRNSGLLQFFRAVTGNSMANARVRAVAAVDNRVTGIRPLPGSSSRCLPLGILEADQSAQRTDTWKYQIELANGQDRYRYDPTTQSVLSGPDGIREIILTVASTEDTTAASNVRVLDLGTRLNEQAVRAQIAGGISRAHLEAWGGELVFADTSLSMDSSPSLVARVLDELADQIGQTRVCLLYRAAAQQYGVGEDHVSVTRVVCIRLMVLEHSDPGGVQLVVQPAAMATRSAVLDGRFEADSNPYLYNLSLID